MWSQTEQKSEEEPSGAGVTLGVVGEDEMAFALALFFAATRGQVPLPSVQSVGVEIRRELPLAKPSLDSLERIAEMDSADLDEIALASAVAVIWYHYEGAKHRQAICSRLVAFYSLMARGQGVVVDTRSHPDSGDPRSMVLEPAVIRAVATAPLTAEGQFDAIKFRELVREVANAGETALSPALSLGAKVRLAAPVQEVVQDLVELLFACESTIAMGDSAQTTHFRVFERLCLPFTAVSGAQNLQPLLTRALILVQSSYPWLSSARVSPLGQLDGISKAFLDQHPQEALRGELALMGSLVQLFRSLLGDAVTLQLLRSVWPLAFLNTETPLPVPR